MTMFLPEEDRYSYSKERLESQISSLFGGTHRRRAGLRSPTASPPGRANDIQRATELARNMVTRWGLSGEAGAAHVQRRGRRGLSGSQRHPAQDRFRDQTQDLIDEEVRTIIDRNYQRSTKLLKENEQRLHVMAGALIRYETIDVDQIKDIMEGREPRPPQDWPDQSPPGGDSPVVEDDSDGEQSPSGSGSIGGPASLH